MKILVCTDGSELSMKAVKEGAKIAKGCAVHEAAIIYVYENLPTYLPWVGEREVVSKEAAARFKELEEQDKEISKGILMAAKKEFQKNNIEVNTIFAEGNPAQIICHVANTEGYDLVILGSRGLGGLQKFFLGSVSNAVVQEVKASVLIIK